MKKGMSVLAIILLSAILIVLVLILFFFSKYFLEARNSIVTDDSKNISEKDFNYYLPGDFAAIKVKRGFFESDIEGVMISFENNEKTYDYKTSDFPGIDETRNYLILKDELLPKVPDDWDFSKVKSISLRYILENGKPSRVIKHTEINQEKVSQNFGEKCFSISESGEKQVFCE